MPRTSSFFRKFIACLTLSLLSAGVMLQLGTPPAPSWLNQTVIFIGCVLCLVIPLAALPVWENQERKGKTDLSFVFLRVQSIIGYLTGFGISLFGWKKLFHLQFRTPLSIADLPMSALSGETLTWYYFGYSNVFGCLIGAIQLTGSFLLFFRRTRFAGALFLFPVMLNILLINIFYQMNAGALVQSIWLTLGLLYLLAGRLPAFIYFLFYGEGNPIPDIQQGITIQKNGRQGLIAGAIGLLSFLFIWSAHHRMPSESSLFGRYEVSEVSSTSRPLFSTFRFASDSAILNRVYFDLNNVCVLEYGSPENRLLSNYRFDESTRQLETRFADKDKSVSWRAMVNREKDNIILIRGIFAGDSVEMILKKR